MIDRRGRSEGPVIYGSLGGTDPRPITINLQLREDSRRRLVTDVLYSTGVLFWCFGNAGKLIRMMACIAHSDVLLEPVLQPEISPVLILP